MKKMMIVLFVVVSACAHRTRTRGSTTVDIQVGANDGAQCFEEVLARVRSLGGGEYDVDRPAGFLRVDPGQWTRHPMVMAVQCQSDGAARVTVVDPRTHRSSTSHIANLRLRAFARELASR